mmetsp:Transcript_5013/g.7079  ORF Transcript_5013/g.7079 Transcript_5013/m.7079 type:complete len:138 (+) Transcript_5013:468-881(+)
MRKALRLVLRDLGGAASIEPRILFVFTRSTGLRTPPRAALSDALCRKFGAFCSLLPPIAFAGTLNPILDTLTAINPRFHNKVKQWLDSLLLLSDYIRPLPYQYQNKKDEETSCSYLLADCHQQLSFLNSSCSTTPRR